MADRKGGPFTRRAALRLLAAAPVAAAATRAALAADDAAPSGTPRKPSAYAKFIAKDEPDLTSGERARLRKQAPGLERALARLREYDLPDEVAPALTFRAQRSRVER